MNIDSNYPALRDKVPAADRRRAERRSAPRDLGNQTRQTEGSHSARGDRRKERRLSRVEAGVPRERRRIVAEPRFAALVLGQIIPQDRSNWAAASHAYAKGVTLSKGASMARSI